MASPWPASVRRLTGRDATLSRTRQTIFQALRNQQQCYHCRRHLHIRQARQHPPTHHHPHDTMPGSLPLLLHLSLSLFCCRPCLSITCVRVVDGLISEQQQRNNNNNNHTKNSFEALDKCITIILCQHRREKKQTKKKRKNRENSYARIGSEPTGSSQPYYNKLQLLAQR